MAAEHELAGGCAEKIFGGKPHGGLQFDLSWKLAPKSLDIQRNVLQTIGARLGLLEFSDGFDYLLEDVLELPGNSMFSKLGSGSGFAQHKFGSNEHSAVAGFYGGHKERRAYGF
jgi:hypothetical protein